MSRMQAPHHQGPLVRATLAIARRKAAGIGGRETESMIEPIEAFAHTPGLMLGYCMLELANERARRVQAHLKELVVLKAATMVGCEYCIDIGSAAVRRAGLTDEQLLALPRHRESGLFDELESLALDYAVALTRTPVSVPDELFEALRDRLGDAGVVELTESIALENLRARFNAAMDVGSAGFTEGMVCARPDAAAARAGESDDAAPVPGEGADARAGGQEALAGIAAGGDATAS